MTMMITLITLVLFVIGTSLLLALFKPLPLKITAWKNNKCVASMIEETHGWEAIKFAYAEIKANGYDQVIIRNAQTGEDYLTIRNWRKLPDEK